MWCAGLSKIWSIAGTIGAIASAGFAFGLWVLLTNSYRLDRQMVIKQVVQHVTEADITIGNDSALDFDAPDAGSSIPDPLLDSIGSMGAKLIKSASGNAAATMSRNSATRSSEHVSRVAKEITMRCLQRWDGPMALRASTDSLGTRSGIRKDKFDSVRAASMLLAMRRYNHSLRDSTAGTCAPLPSTRRKYATSKLYHGPTDFLSKHSMRTGRMLQCSIQHWSNQY